MPIASRRVPHICFVAPYAYPLLGDKTDIAVVGGAEMQQVIVARALVARGYPVSMICLNFGQDDRVTIDGVRVYRSFRPAAGLPLVRFFWPRLASTWACLNRVNADIYYQRAAGMLTGVVAFFCSRRGKKSIFAVASNLDLSKDSAVVRCWPDRGIYEYGLRNVDQILVQNPEQARLCQANIAREPVLIPNCYQATGPKELTKRDYILWVSTIRKGKCPDLFLDLAEALPEFRFRMVGGHDCEEYDLFESIRVRASSMANVDFTGFVPYSQIDKQFDGAKLLVSTSASEGFPNIFLQAWSRRVPTLSFVDCGARINEKPVGRIVDSIDEMKSAIMQWMSSDFELELQGNRCLEYFEKNHSVELVLDLYEDVFDKLIPR